MTGGIHWAAEDHAIATRGLLRVGRLTLFCRKEAASDAGFRCVLRHIGVMQGSAQRLRIRLSARCGGRRSLDEQR